MLNVLFCCFYLYVRFRYILRGLIFGLRNTIILVREVGLLLYFGIWDKVGKGRENIEKGNFFGVGEWRLEV